MEAVKTIQDRFYEDFPPCKEEEEYAFATPSTMKPTQWDCHKNGLNQICPYCTVSGDIRVTPFYDNAKVKTAVEGCVVRCFGMACCCGAGAGVSCTCFVHVCVMLCGLAACVLTCMLSQLRCRAERWPRGYPHPWPRVQVHSEGASRCATMPPGPRVLIHPTFRSQGDDGEESKEDGDRAKITLEWGSHEMEGVACSLSSPGFAGA